MRISSTGGIPPNPSENPSGPKGTSNFKLKHDAVSSDFDPIYEMFKDPKNRLDLIHFLEATKTKLEKERDWEPTFPPPLEKPHTPRQKELYQQAIDLVNKSLNELVNTDHPDTENSYKDFVKAMEIAMKASYDDGGKYPDIDPDIHPHKV